MKIWTKGHGKDIAVRTRGNGTLSDQIRELDAIIDYAKRRATEMAMLANKINGIDPAIMAANEQLKRECANAVRTISAVEADMKKKAQHKGPMQKLDEKEVGKGA